MFVDGNYCASVFVVPILNIWYHFNACVSKHLNTIEKCHVCKMSKNRLHMNYVY
jgi:hypothetical protein